MSLLKNSLELLWARRMCKMDEKPIVVLLGGAGFIGTHLMLELHGDYQVAVIDHHPPSEDAVNWAVKRAQGLPVLFYRCDLQSEVNETWPVLPRVPHCGIMLAARK